MELQIKRLKNFKQMEKYMKLELIYILNVQLHYINQFIYS